MKTMGCAGIAVRWATRWALALLIASSLWAQQYKADKAGPPPPELAAGIVGALSPYGFQITNNGARYCEIWLRASLPQSPPSNEPNVTLPNIAVGTLVGVIRFDGKGTDRRGQTIQPGVYTLRYAIMPTTDAHQGAAPQRDFLLLTPASDDRDVNTISKLDALLALSRKASATGHPAVLSLWKADTDAPGFSEQGDADWVLQSKIGDTPVAIIVAGSAG